jgi:hypothetical protein
VGDPVGGRHAAHFYGHLPGFGTIVDLGKNVAVDVNHGVYNLIRTHQDGESIGPSGDRAIEKTKAYFTFRSLEELITRSPDQPMQLPVPAFSCTIVNTTFLFSP